MNNSDFLKEGLNSIGIEYTSSDIDLLLLYLREITLWNRKYGLVRAEGKELMVKHVFDSLAPLPLLTQMNFDTVADAGSGAGFPGIPLALFLKDKRFTLIERSGKRCGFLLNIISLLHLSDRVFLREASVEDVDERFDVVVFRAFRQLNEFIVPLMDLLVPGGVLFAYKGKRKTILREISLLGERERIGAEIQKIDVPFLEDERHILKLRKSHQ